MAEGVTKTKTRGDIGLTANEDKDVQRSLLNGSADNEWFSSLIGSIFAGQNRGNLKRVHLYLYSRAYFSFRVCVNVAQEAARRGNHTTFRAKRALRSLL